MCGSLRRKRHVRSTDYRCIVGDKVVEEKWKGLGVNDHWQQMKGIMMETAQDMWNDKGSTQTQGNMVVE